MATRYVDTDGISGEFDSLTLALADITFPLSEDEIIYVAASTGVPDAGVTIPNTGGTYSLSIIDPIYRFGWDPEGYVIETVNSTRCVTITGGGVGSNSWVNVTGLQMLRSAQTSANQQLMMVGDLRAGSIVVDRCSFNAAFAASNNAVRMIWVGTDSRYNCVTQFKNNLILGPISGDTAHDVFYFGNTFAPNTTYIDNNTIVRGTRAGAQLNSAERERGNVWLANNIWISASPSAFSYVNSTNSVWGADFDTTPNPENEPLWANWTESNQVNADLSATFVDAAEDDYRLAESDTVARDLGADLSDLAPYAVTHDKINTSRPQGEAFDIGAYEFIAPEVFNYPRFLMGPKA